MICRFFVLLALASWHAAALGAAGPPTYGRLSHPLNCTADAFNHVLPPFAKIVSAVPVAAGHEYGEGAANPAWPTNPTNLPELCALTVNVSSSPISNYRFGLFLPAQWNSRFLAVGNGGFSGGINWLSMGNGVRYDMAALSTDTGHNSTTADLTWALNNPERREDFGYRALHNSVQIGKRLTEAFYGRRISYSYYAGFSTGGRQGLKEAQFSPGTFDGLAIGAPAWWTSHLQPWTTKVATYNLPITDLKHIPRELFAAIADEAIRQCDPVDGLVDGIISTPDLCNFNPDALLCGTTGRNSTNCLTPLQIKTLRSIYADYRAEGKFAFPGMEVGSESEWDRMIASPQPNIQGDGYIQYFLYNDPTWNWTQYKDSMVWEADASDPGNCTADDFDMSRFKRRGGKILMYHGLSDALIPPRSSMVFYERVAEAMGGFDALKTWFRFFPVPGMVHVRGSPVKAPWYIGGVYAAGLLGTDVYSTPGFEDARHDVLLALINWVEKKQPVDNIIATTWNSDSAPSSGVLRQRPLCPYPKRQTYDGAGNPNKPGSFYCV